MFGAGGGIAGGVCGVGRGAEQSVHAGRAAARSVLGMGRDELRVGVLPGREARRCLLRGGRRMQDLRRT